MPELLSAVADVLWPLLVGLAVLVFARPLAGLLRSGRDRDEVTFEIGGQRITFGKLREQQNALTSDLQRQIAELRAQLAGTPVAEVTVLANPDVAVLWVDDHPENNALIIDQLRTAGTTVDLARTTAEGLERVSRREYRVVISDLGRTEDGRYRTAAGLELVRGLSEAGMRVPIIIFASQRGVATYAGDAAAAGAQAVTASAADLTAFLRRHGVMA